MLCAQQINRSKDMECLFACSKNVQTSFPVRPSLGHWGFSVHCRSHLFVNFLCWLQCLQKRCEGNLKIAFVTTSVCITKTIFERSSHMRFCVAQYFHAMGGTTRDVLLKNVGDGCHLFARPLQQRKVFACSGADAEKHPYNWWARAASVPLNHLGVVTYPQ